MILITLKRKPSSYVPTLYLFSVGARKYQLKKWINVLLFFNQNRIFDLSLQEMLCLFRFDHFEVTYCHPTSSSVKYSGFNTDLYI